MAFQKFQYYAMKNILNCGYECWIETKFSHQYIVDFIENFDLVICLFLAGCEGFFFTIVLKNTGTHSSLTENYF